MDMAIIDEKTKRIIELQVKIEQLFVRQQRGDILYALAMLSGKIIGEYGSSKYQRDEAEIAFRKKVHGSRLFSEMENEE
jgi:hypothetical protein